MRTTPFLAGILVSAIVWISGCSSSSTQVPPQKGAAPEGEAQAFTLTSEQEQEIEKDIERAVSASLDKKTKENAKATFRDEACVDGCKRTYRNKVKAYRAMFESSGTVYYQNIGWLNGVLANARSEFDACLASCN